MNEEKNENFPASIAADQTGDEIPLANEVDAKTGEESNDGQFKINGSIGAEEIASRLDDLSEQLENLSTEFNSKIKYDRHKEKIIDDLHREVQEYKNDLLKNLLKPLIMDIIHTIDDIAKLVNNHRIKNPSELDPLKIIKQMEDISSDLEEILCRQGMEPFNCDQSEFNPKQQKIIKTEYSKDPSKDKTISSRVLNGYQWEGKVLRPEMVNVYIYKPESNEQNLTKNEEKEL
jgi:molecular chaperone GrpE